MKKLNSKILIVAAAMLLVAGCGKDEKVEEVIRPVKVVVAGEIKLLKILYFQGLQCLVKRQFYPLK